MTEEKKEMFQEIEATKLEVKRSDVAATMLDGLIDMAKDRRVGLMSAVETMIYNVAGRKLMGIVGVAGYNLTNVNDSVEKDIFVGLIASADSSFRKGKKGKNALMDGVENAITSYLGRNLMVWYGTDDKVIFPAPKETSESA